ncbi:MAG: hypothetical protein KIT69_21855, partial [Propionibacteriaceae bacterium]|nr:hypothetical protein [Propionibacteriaceae bacterium]
DARIRRQHEWKLAMDDAHPQEDAGRGRSAQARQQPRSGSMRQPDKAAGAVAFVTANLLCSTGGITPARLTICLGC